MFLLISGEAIDIYQSFSVLWPIFHPAASTEIAGQENKGEAGKHSHSAGATCASLLAIAYRALAGWPLTTPTVQPIRGVPVVSTSRYSALYNLLLHCSRAGIEQKTNDDISILRLSYKTHSSFHPGLFLSIIMCSKKVQLPCSKKKKHPIKKPTCWGTGAASDNHVCEAEYRS